MKTAECQQEPIGLERILHIPFLHHWFELLDPGMEKVLYDSRSMYLFMRIDLGNDPVPDDTAIRQFRHLKEWNDLGDELFRLVNVYLEKSMKVRRSTIMDTTIINAPSSTKNEEKPHDLDMHQTKNGNQFYFA
ncbi:MAG: transposase [Candidatus Thiodiazotropha endolucinida]